LDIDSSVENSASKSISDFVRNSTPDWVERLRSLIRIPSFFGAEHDFVTAVARSIEALGMTTHRVPHDPTILKSLPSAQPPICEISGRHSLAVRLKGTGGKGGKRSLALNAHMDIVPVGDPSAWTHPPFEGFMDGTQNVMHGRGSMDDKAGVTILLAVMETMSRLKLVPQGDVVFHFVLEDETTGNGSLLCLNAGYRADAAIILDGTRPDRAIRQHAGNLQFGLHVRGLPASVSVSHMGVNAAEMLARLLVHLRDSFARLNDGRVTPWTRFPSPFQLIVQSMHSDGELLTVPEIARGQCHVTFPPPASLDSTRRMLEHHVSEFARTHGLPEAPRITWGPLVVDAVESNTAELEGTLQESAKSLGMPPIDVGPSTGISDMRHFTERGIPCLLYGPGRGFNPHRPNEHFYVEDLPRMVEFFLEFIRRWCGLR
jgi:acetylornithine deacetylase